MSDVWQQFADWETNETFTPRKRHLLDDMNETSERLWPGQDSSNDERSGESEDGSWDAEIMGGVVSIDGASSGEVEVVEAIKGGGISLEIPSQLSPPLRPSFDDIENEGVELHTTTDHILSSDPFEDFAVDSGSEKDFLITHLRTHAPVDEVEKLRRTLEMDSLSVPIAVHEWDTRLTQEEFEEIARTARVSDIEYGGEDWQEFKFLQSATSAEIDARLYELILSGQDENGDAPLPSIEYPAPHLLLQKKVETFALSHMFSVQKHVKPTILQRREFTRDVYDYARALGMGRHQAEMEVARAKVAYRQERGLTGGLRLDESDDESTLGVEIDDALEYITSMKNGMQHGPVDPAGAWQEISRLQAKCSVSNTSTNKGGGKVSSTDSKPVPAKAIGKERGRRAQKLQNVAKKEKKIVAVLNTVSMEANTSGGPRTSKKRKRPSGSKAPEAIHSKSVHPSPYFKPVVAIASTQLKTNSAGGASAEESKTNPVAVEAKDLLSAKDSVKPDYQKNAESDQEGQLDLSSGDRRPRKKKKRSRKRPGDATVSGGGTISTMEVQSHDSSTLEKSQYAAPNGLRIEELEVKEHLPQSRIDNDGSGQNVPVENPIIQPLLELNSTNANMKKRGRRDRGSRRKTAHTDSNAIRSSEVAAAKDHHS